MSYVRPAAERCKGLTKKGERCNGGAQDNGYCGTHQDQAQKEEEYYAALTDIEKEGEYLAEIARNYTPGPKKEDDQMDEETLSNPPFGWKDQPSEPEMPPPPTDEDYELPPPLPAEGMASIEKKDPEFDGFIATFHAEDGKVYIVITGHRPPKIGGYKDDAELRVKVRDEIRAKLESACEKFGKENVELLVGGALGVDTDAARIAYQMGIPFHLFQPCRNQESRWPKDSQERFRRMRDKAKSVILVHDGPYNNSCMQQRNVAMTNSAHYMLAVWDGTRGGTGNCVNYAIKKLGRNKIVQINPTKL